MIISPKRVMFETEKDIIDYVSKGLPPSKDNFKLLIDMIKDPYGESNIQNNKMNIDPSILLKQDKETLEKVLKRVYENRVTDKNNICTGICIGIAVIVLHGLFRRK